MFPCKCRRAKSAVVAALFIAAVSSIPTARGQITYVKTIGSLGGSGTGAFNDPFGITVSTAGQVFVADYGNNRVQVFNTNLGYQASITTWSGGTGGFAGPVGVAVSPTGQVFVDDYGNSRVQVFGSNLAYQTFVGGSSAGTANGQFEAPQSVAVSPTGQIYVADTNNNRIQIFNSTFAYQSSIGA